MRAPNPRVVSGTFVGFMAGILVTLAATGVMSRSTASRRVVATLPPQLLMSSSEVRDRVRLLARRTLGPAYPNAKLPRVIDVAASNATALSGLSDRTKTAKYSVSIVFRLNDHPLGRVWRFRAAKADVFAMMKAIYTSALPISDLEMEGIYPLKRNHGLHDQRVVVAFMDRPAAQLIPWKKWGRDKEAKLWSILPYHYVDPRFG